jgi:hypothetical protein
MYIEIDRSENVMHKVRDLAGRPAMGREARIFIRVFQGICSTLHRKQEKERIIKKEEEENHLHILIKLIFLKLFDNLEIRVY